MIVPGLLSDKIDTDITLALCNGLGDDLVILESGIFLGSWCILLNNYLTNRRIEFFGIDDMRFIKDAQSFEWYKNFNASFKKEIDSGELDDLLLAPTQTILEAVVRRRALLLTGKEITISVTESLGKISSPDIIHHDCAQAWHGNYKLFKDYIDIMHNRTILIVDNFGPEQPMRTLSLSVFINQKKLWPVGFGRHKSFLVNNKEYSEYLTDEIRKVQFEFNLTFFRDEYFEKSYFTLLPIEQY